MNPSNNFFFCVLAIVSMSLSNMAFAITCADLNGAHVRSQEITPKYLGFFGSQFAAESINNSVGVYGSSFGVDSVRNEFSAYGSSFRTFSATNDFSFSPPVIYKFGTAIGFLTTNTTVASGVSLDVIDANCSFSATSAFIEPFSLSSLDASDGTLVGQVELSWAAATGATFYTILVAASELGERTFIGTTTSTSAVITGVTPNTNFFYFVFPENQFGDGLGLFDIGSSAAPAASSFDSDGDSIDDTQDNCPSVVNTNQTDTDADGQGDECDADDDGDSIPDEQDAFQFDSSESVDTDGDGTGDNADIDDDNDSVLDEDDAFPLDQDESIDTDGDGIGNNADTDDDGDGFLDSDDALPLVATESIDTDGDGTGDNADTDDDGDGTPDVSDLFPLDGSQAACVGTSSGAIRLNAGQFVELPVRFTCLIAPAGESLGVPSSATAVSLNVTAVTPDAPGFVTVYPCGVARPNASNLNFVAGDVVPNGVVAPIGSNGSVCLFSSQATDLIVDVAGWFEGDAFVGATPQRLVDTRDGTGGQFAKLVAESPLVVQATGITATTAAGSATTIPTTAGTVALNITVVNPDSPGFITVYPCDAPRPLASNLNYVAGQVVANGVIAPVSSAGKVCLYSQSPTDVIVDLAGWFPGNAFTGATPNRLVDTRDGTGAPLAKLTPTGQLSVVVQGSILSVNGNSVQVPSNASAAALNVTVVNPESAGFVTVWPCSAARPNASNLNFTAEQVVANNVVAPIGEQGNVCFFASQNTDIIVDISGYFTGESGNQFVGSTPKRLVDTRDGTGPAPQ